MKDEKQASVQRLASSLKKILQQKSGVRNEFRYNNRTGHINWVFESKNGKTRAFGITHSPETFGRGNMPLTKNPKKGDQQDAYIRNGVISDSDKTFSKKTKRLQFSQEDIPNVKSKRRNYIKRRKQSRKIKKQVSR